MQKDAYLNVNREQQSVKLTKAHMEYKETCARLREFLNYTIML